ncbi:phosphate signaling complex protein PhoU [Streptomyces sp. NPDC059627]
MREAYHEELASISEGLVSMANRVGSALGRATSALLDTDLRLAESVISAHSKVEDLQRDLDDRAIAVLARQQPVATDLRVVVTSLRMSADLERCSVLAQHVAKLARLRYPVQAVPQDLRRTILELSQLAQRLMAQAADVLVSHDLDAALQMEQGDDRIDELHRSIFQHLMDERWHQGVETAVDATLLGRYYERFADHVVSVARRVVFQVTGEQPEELAATAPTPRTQTA